MKAFMVKDLMINVIPQEIGSSGVAYPGPDDDITDFPPTITPVIAVARFSPRFHVITQVAEGSIERLSPEILDNVALEAGKAAVAGAFIGTAQCTIDMPTCEANQIISPVASHNALRFEDLAIAKGLLVEAVERITALEKSRLRLASAQAEELIPRLEGALEELEMYQKG